MTDWNETLIRENASIRDAIKVIDHNSVQIALVVGENKKLFGTVTDGDIRRGILSGIPIDDSVQKVMNNTPTVVRANEAKKSILMIMKRNGIHQIPVVNDAGCVEGIEVLNEIIQKPERDNPVVIMAGGIGSRLLPLTEDCPKPMLKVGSKPILSIILENFIEYGFRKFYIAVNYKSGVIEEYFKDGSKLGVEINYIKENKRLGTAGALGLLTERVSHPIIVMNGDLLTKVNFDHLLNFHAEHDADATLCVRDYNFQIPYGVVKMEKYQLICIEEKPVHHFFVNAGVYVFEPTLLELIPKDKSFDMPQLFEKLLDKKKDTAVFPIREYWLDVGRMGDFEKANVEYDRHFTDLYNIDN